MYGDKTNLLSLKKETDLKTIISLGMRTVGVQETIEVIKVHQNL